MRLRIAAGLLAGGMLVTACGGGSPKASPSSPSPAPSASRTTSSRGLLLAGSSCRQHLGGTVAFQDAARHLAVRISTGRPHVVDHALASYAHGPVNGHFLVVDVTLTNLATTGLLVDPTRFVLTTSSGRRLTVDSGNAPSSGASHVLDPTLLTPRGSDAGPLIFDTPGLHGRIVYAPAGHSECTWTF
jgi:hypothetical protein